MTRAETRRTLELIQSVIGHDLDTLKLAVKVSDSQNKVIISKVHNLAVDVGTMIANLQQIITLLLELAEQPQTHADAQRIIKDFLFQRAKKLQ